MAGAEKAWDRLKKSEEKTKKQHEAAMKTKVSNTASAIGSGNRANSTKPKVMKSSDIQRQPAAKKVNSYDWEKREARNGEIRNRMENEFRSEGRKKYDESNTRNDSRGYARSGDSSQKNSSRTREETVKRNTYANNYAKQKMKDTIKTQFVNQYQEADRKWREQQKKR